MTIKYLLSLSLGLTVLSASVGETQKANAATPWQLTQTFLNPTPDFADYFGGSVSISGNNVLIGAEGDNRRALRPGAAYLFDGTTGALTQTFLNPTPDFADVFGGSVSISGNNVLIGAYSDNTGADDAGAAYLFDATTGSLTQTFLNPTPERFDRFGISVSISGNNVLIGAYSDNTGADNAGAAYLFDGTTGSLLQTFLNPTPEVGDYFGGSVSISGNNVLIGAEGDNTGADDAGAAYLFDGTTGSLLQTFLNPTPQAFDNFGRSVSISGNNVLIGASNDNTGADDAGAVYLFDGTTGSLLQTFLNPTPERFDNFGRSISISGNNVLIGASGDNTGADSAGAAYLFDGTTGSLLQTFLNPTPEEIDQFSSVAISGNNILIGASFDNTGADRAGAAYLYQPIPEPFTILGAGTAAAFGVFYKRRLAKKR